VKLAFPLSGSDRAQWSRLADGLAAAVAASLPWSTSATSILIVLWLIVVIPTLDWVDVRRELFSAVGGLPVLLWVLGAIGMLWTGDASPYERLAGLSGFHKLLFIPLLFAQFRRSENVHWVIYGFFSAALVLLAVSALYAFSPVLRHSVEVPGVPVKDYISQSGIFQICAFGLLFLTLEKPLQPLRILLLGVLAAAFVADIAYIASSRTAFVVMPVLILLLGLRRFGWKGLVGALLLAAVLAGVLWASSPYMRARIGSVVAEAQHSRTDVFQTSTGQRLEFWQKSLGFVQQAPVFGNGTGSIRPLFAKAAAGETGAAGVAADNPHQQTFVVAIQLGLLGAAVLWGMWIVHFLLFRVPGFLPWLGLVVVTQNIVSSLFNSHLFDFNQGWLYVLGVGILGGATLRQIGTADAAAKGHLAG
jgi:O-antigen ligase